ncbi:valine--tRNA ligase [candidate division WOR-3 bacterium 4484_100]|uniref:Valine--tRNA ligase n=1 Tax=candidate division WOR-3 bacterium 4484_100 TaxID=1936077 RepID=A0A1V4QFK5_UNCW3|nr:MAG: valine--tRNA ligase [candidate division WOR-3 bacterium 4484_100]
MNGFTKKYNPAGIEENWYKFWLENELFKPDYDSSKKTYTIVIPPPNVTGRLTLGHILNNSVQDILIRYKRLNDFNVRWVLGMDHAGIATQVVVEERLRKKGIKKEDLGRERFVEEVWKWKEEYAEVIRQQLRKMGCALDWSNEHFTLSKEYSKKVIKVFVELYKKGLLYKGEYIVNWCPRCRTAISDEQVETENEPGKLYYISYPIADSDQTITVATTRPETMLGDTAICVNPEDERYKNLIGRNAILPIMNRRIPIIADHYVDPEFGTGALKVTPAHDPFDFELAKKHNLQFINIMNPDATLNENTGQFQGMERYQARKRVLEKLEELGLLQKIEDYKIPLAKCERCRTPIEPRISKQWFVKMKPLAGPALDVVKNGRIKIYPKRWVNLYNHWLENVRDWCISRQLWWGHRIPVYYCSKCYNPEDDSSKGIIVSEERPEKCPDCGSTDIEQEQDVLDTWFSSWLWPFATLGWPEPTRDYQLFYPTSTLATGWDIIYLWVARMIMAGLEFTGNIPFYDVVFHPMIRDAQGRKMSKSLGNSPEPMELIDKYGADALRLGLLLITPKEQDVLFSEKSIDVGRKFCNKLWNASRLIWMNCQEGDENDLSNPSPFDNWLFSEFNRLLADIERHLENYELNAIARRLYDFTWHTFCDRYLEFIKVVPSKNIAKFLLKQLIIILHPLIPFITEELYHKFNFPKKSIFLEKWPRPIEVSAETDDVEKLINLIDGIRNIRGLFNIGNKRPLDIIVNCQTQFEKFLSTNIEVLKRLCSINDIQFNIELKEPGASVIMPDIECFVKLGGLDTKKEKMRLQKEISFLENRIAEINARLNNPDYLKKARAHIKEQERERLSEFIKKKEGIEKAIARL